MRSLHSTTALALKLAGVMAWPCISTSASFSYVQVGVRPALAWLLVCQARRLMLQPCACLCCCQPSS